MTSDQAAAPTAPDEPDTAEANAPEATPPGAVVVPRCRATITFGKNDAERGTLACEREAGHKIELVYVDSGTPAQEFMHFADGMGWYDHAPGAISHEAAVAYDQEYVELEQQASPILARARELVGGAIARTQQLEAEREAASQAAEQARDDRFATALAAPAPEDGTAIFDLVRDTDVTGVSGTGIVATGCRFADGTVALRWSSTGGRSSTAVWATLDDVEAVHGHEGATRVIWR